ncbi:MAG: MarR family transcriptional regulator [Alteraurantiacibacter sp.]
MVQSSPDEAGEGSPAPARNAETEVWLALMALHGEIFGRLNRAINREFGITLAKFDVLAQLYRVPDGLTQTALSRQLKVTGGNVTGMVQRLISDSLISREVAQNDRRAFIVRLTSLGRETYLNARIRHDELLASFIGQLGSERLATLTETLRQTGHVLARSDSGRAA